MHTLGIKVLATGQVEQRPQYIGALRRGLGLTGYTKAIASIGDIDTEASFDLPQVFVELAAEIGQPGIVGGLQDDVPDGIIRIQWLNDCPLVSSCR